MKTIYKILVILVLQSTCIQAQTIVDLSNRNGEHNSNTYYKDTTNRLNPFNGTWVYDDGVTYIKLVLIKKIQAPVGDYFEDILIGEFQYKVDGNEIINKLSNINGILPNIRLHGIDGNYFWNNHTPFDDYTTDNFRLNVSINENGCISDIDIRTLIHNGQQAVQIFKRKPLDLGQNCTPIIPGGFYYLIKQ
jgi:hypothetical protein